MKFDTLAVRHIYNYQSIISLFGS